MKNPVWSKVIPACPDPARARQMLELFEGTPGVEVLEAADEDQAGVPPPVGGLGVPACVVEAADRQVVRLEPAAGADVVAERPRPRRQALAVVDDILPTPAADREEVDYEPPLAADVQ
ncbi:MAG TPA: hypothetical protein P5233_14020, partial [Candidatus Paceibacterota bacterium]|nr:hypothetical protein [Candidatus Paceibacterota bacterium]